MLMQWYNSATVGLHLAFKWLFLVQITYCFSPKAVHHGAERNWSRWKKAEAPSTVGCTAIQVRLPSILWDKAHSRWFGIRVPWRAWTPACSWERSGYPIPSNRTGCFLEQLPRTWTSTVVHIRNNISTVNRFEPKMILFLATAGLCIMS